MAFHSDAMLDTLFPGYSSDLNMVYVGHWPSSIMPQQAGIDLVTSLDWNAWDEYILGLWNPNFSTDFPHTSNQSLLQFTASSIDQGKITTSTTTFVPLQTSASEDNATSLGSSNLLGLDTRQDALFQQVTRLGGMEGFSAATSYFQTNLPVHEMSTQLMRFLNHQGVVR